MCVKGDKAGQEPELVPATKLKPAPPNNELLKRPTVFLLLESSLHIIKESRLQVESVPLPTNLISTSNEAAIDNY